MANENSGRESPKALLQEIVSEEIKKSRLKIMTEASVYLSVAAFFLGGYLLLTRPEQPSDQAPSPQTHQTESATIQHAYPLEKVVGITTAMMAMADQKQSIIELNYAMEIINKRQEGQLSAPVQFTPSADSPWLDRHKTMVYYHAAVDYLKTSNSKYLEVLSSQPINIDIQSPLPVSEDDRREMEVKANYKLIALLQDAVNEANSSNLYTDIKMLTQLWSNERMPALDASETAIYTAQSEKITRNLNSSQ